MSKASLSFPAEGIQQKYKKLIGAGALFLALGLAIVGGVFAYFYATGEYHKDSANLYQIMPILLFFIPGYGLRTLRQGQREKTLYEAANPQNLSFDHDGIEGPIILLEGAVRDYLREKKSPVFSIAWDEVDGFVVEPVRGTKRNSSPPYYKVVLKDDGPIYYILRDYFKAVEDQILGFVKGQLKTEQIVMNDEIQSEAG